MWQSNLKTLVKPLILVKSRIPCYEEMRIMPVRLDERLWYHDLQTYLETGQFPEDVYKKERLSLKMFSRQFINLNGMLYKRMQTGVHL